MILAHTLGEGGPEIEFLILAAGMLVLGIIFFLQKTVQPQVPLVLVLGAFALTAGAFAFGGDEDGGGASTEATVQVLSPQDGASVPADQPLTLEVRIVGGSLTDASDSDDPNAGHLHIYVDGKLVSMPSVETPEIAGDRLGPGEHEITVEFTQADHRSFDPPVTSEITVSAE